MDYILLPTQHGVLDGVLFDDSRNNTLDVSIHVILLSLFPLLILIPCWRGFFNRFELVVFLLYLPFFVFDETNKYKHLKIKLYNQSYIYSGSISRKKSQYL